MNSVFRQRAKSKASKTTSLMQQELAGTQHILQIKPSKLQTELRLRSGRLYHSGDYSIQHSFSIQCWRGIDNLLMKTRQDPNETRPERHITVYRQHPQEPSTTLRELFTYPPIITTGWWCGCRPTSPMEHWFLERYADYPDTSCYPRKRVALTQSRSASNNSAPGPHRV